MAPLAELVMTLSGPAYERLVAVSKLILSMEI